MRSHPKFRLLGITPGIVDGEHARKMGAARLLFDYLVAKQYDGGIDGAVNYGRPLTVDQIRAEIPNAPDGRTIRRYVATLRDRGYIRTHRTYRHGLRFWILNQKKFQLALPFRSRPEIVPAPVENLRISSDIPKSERTSLVVRAGVSGQGCPEKSLEFESIKENLDGLTPTPNPSTEENLNGNTAPATSPAFEQLMLESIEDSPEKTELMERLRAIARRHAL